MEVRATDGDGRAYERINHVVALVTGAASNLLFRSKGTLQAFVDNIGVGSGLDLECSWFAVTPNEEVVMSYSHRLS
jgi:hypothetical protein